jgi:D-amino-acid dehydrogenase
VTIDRPAAAPVIPVLNAAKKVLITPIGHRLRFAGTMEFAGLDLTLNQKRADAVLRGGVEVMAKAPSLQNVQAWCGLRPCTPDGLPIVGRAPTHPHVYLSTGHAMLGYTLGPITGKLIAEMIAGERSSIGIHQLRVDRF